MKKRQKLTQQEKREQIDAVAEELIRRLKDAGFILQRYDSYSTMSIYLKLDYGVCNSIRISDHKGKKHLAYRYNFLTNIPKHTPYHTTITSQGWKRHFYRPESVDVFMEQLEKDYRKRIERYGVDGYKRLMLQNKQAGQTQKGFWQKAVLI